jgi:sortase (surface protein transpeptidase)
MPGQVGPAVVLAHINADGRPGFGAGFHTLAPGDTIDVTTPTGPVSFAVTRTTTVPKAEFPTAAVYSDTKDPELRLITCGGTLDRGAHNYLGQTIVYATKV